MATVQNEPAVVSGVITAAAGATIALIVAFGAPVTEEQRAAILGVIPPYVVLIMAAVVWIRSKVIPAGQVVERVETRDGEETVVAGQANSIPTGAAIRPLAVDPVYEPRHAAEDPPDA